MGDGHSDAGRRARLVVGILSDLHLKDKAEYTAIKHPVAAGAAAGGLTACAINFLMRKLGVSETKSLIVSAVLGCIAGVFTHRAITCHSENIYIGD